jgi:hypothetical protein
MFRPPPDSFRFSFASSLLLNNDTTYLEFVYVRIITVQIQYLGI